MADPGGQPVPLRYTDNIYWYAVTAAAAWIGEQMATSIRTLGDGRITLVALYDDKRAADPKNPCLLYTSPSPRD